MQGLTYTEVGATSGPLPPGYHHVRVERVIGRGRALFERAADALMSGQVQRRAGAAVTSSDIPFRAGTRVDMRLGWGPFAVAIPCLVVWADRMPQRCGFAYGTLPGHPERGEERFELALEPNGDVVSGSWPLGAGPVVHPHRGTGGAWHPGVDDPQVSAGAVTLSRRSHRWRRDMVSVARERMES